MIQKKLSEITKDDIDTLIKIQSPLEGRTIDYKLTMPGGQNQDRNEFLTDISSFANSIGGVISYME